jgi:hypothetical protein
MASLFRKSFSRRLVALVALGIVSACPLVIATGAVAQTSSAPRSTSLQNVNIRVEAADPLPSEQAAYQAYAEALTDVGNSSIDALQAHVPALVAALNSAPASYPVISETSDGWLIRADDRDEIIALAQWVGNIERARGATEVRVVARPNVYPGITFLLGSAAVERRDWDAAASVLDRGLRLQPLDPQNLNEKLVVLHALRKWDEAYRLVSAALASDDPLIDLQRPLLQRRLGYTLIELGLLDEARAAYEASLEAEPENDVARCELRLIADLQAGNVARAGPGDIITNEAATQRQHCA